MKAKKLRTKSQLFILLAFFLVPILDIFRLDLITQSFYLFRKGFSFGVGFIYLLAVLLLVIIFLAISKWYERKFCSWVCPHNTVVNVLYKLSSQAFLKKRPKLRTVTMFITSLFVSISASFGLLAYFINPTYLAATIIKLQLLSVVGTLFVFLTTIFFLIIHHLKQRFCSNACPYGHFQKLFADKSKKENHFRFLKGINLLLLTLLIGLLFSLVAFSLTSNQYTVKISENVIGVQLEDYKIFSYDIQIRNLASIVHSFSVTADIPLNWDLMNDEFITVDHNETQKSSLIFKIPKEDFHKNYLITIEIKNITTNTIQTKNIAIHS
jgi:hypothetical protein